MNVAKILITVHRSFYRVFLGALLLLITEGGVANAQSFMPVKQYPQQYFQWPVDAIKALVANFGELRTNHYHMGLDCRTEQVENKPILAAADGYIAKVKILICFHLFIPSEKALIK